jgi:hypothetical protein
MMTLNYKSSDGRYTVQFTGNNQKELFESIAQFEEVFCDNTVCGHCKEENTRLSVREVEGNKYYERVCNACHYRFSYGQTKKNDKLFPKWSTGWTKYEKPKDDEESVKPVKKGGK